MDLGIFFNVVSQPIVETKTYCLCMEENFNEIDIFYVIQMDIRIELL